MPVRRSDGSCRTSRRLAGAVLVIAATTACGAAASTPPAFAASTPSKAQQAFDKMTESERIGQLLMVATPTTSLSAAARTAITKYHVGSLILTGTTSAGLTRIRGVTATLRALAPKGVGLFVSTDQEGGYVQRLQGSGFSTIPTALAQGRLATSTLQADWTKWARQLTRAGVNLDLGPVLDTVPAGFGSNPPIGNLDREYGHTIGRVSAHGLAVLRGLAAGGVDATAKHFPGLGRTRGNTDTTRDVKDTVTTRHDAYLAPFAAAAKAKVPFMMMSTAIYTKIDATHPAAFSHTILTGMLRDDLGFRGVIISDDLGEAVQVSRYSVAHRAVDFIAAGGDVVLTIDSAQAATMTAALLARTRSSATFKKQVDAAALLVLQAKQTRGLL